MIKRYYKRDAQVIWPPVEVDRFKLPSPAPLRHGFVVAGRQTPYKSFDLAIEACDELKVPLIVIGDGPDHKRLEKLADRLPGRGTTFLTDVSDSGIVEHFQTALGFIFPTNVEDFGVVAVEAMAAGTPVIAYNKGGPLDYVVPNQTGLLFDRQSVKSLAAALETVLNKTWDYPAIAKHAQPFSVDAFRQHIQKYIKECLRERV
jgi:glycosyltransferase involved in cell wall biosynthesis